MLKLLLDEHISSDVAHGLRRHRQGLEVHWMLEWNDGRLLGQADASILCEAAAQGLTLVTYDRKTIPPVLKDWAEEGRSHGGVIFVDEKSIYPANIGGLIRTLRRLWENTKDWDWTNRVVYVRRIMR